MVGHLLSGVCRSHYPAVIYKNGSALFSLFYLGYGALSVRLGLCLLMSILGLSL